MTIQEAQSRLLFQLYHLYGNAEAANIADLVMEKLTGWKRIDRLLHKNVKISAAMELQLDRYITDISRNRPVQYVIHECWFYGLKFYVDERVLIPRSETEELVDLVLKSSNLKEPALIMDIGTGSGCIPVAIKKNWVSAAVYSCDISADAIAVAELNAAANETTITFIKADILNTDNWAQLPECQVIVSNPPYIPLEEKDTLEAHVVNYEPHLALFVNDADPLKFYRSIAAFGNQKLQRGGKIYVEVHEDLAQPTAEMFMAEGYADLKIKRDMQGKERMLVCTRK